MENDTVSVESTINQTDNQRWIIDNSGVDKVRVKIEAKEAENVDNIDSAEKPLGETGNFNNHFKAIIKYNDKSDIPIKIEPYIHILEGRDDMDSIENVQLGLMNQRRIDYKEGKDICIKSEAKQFEDAESTDSAEKSFFGTVHSFTNNKKTIAYQEETYIPIKIETSIYEDVHDSDLAEKAPEENDDQLKPIAESGQGSSTSKANAKNPYSLRVKRSQFKDFGLAVYSDETEISLAEKEPINERKVNILNDIVATSDIVVKTELIEGSELKALEYNEKPEMCVAEYEYSGYVGLEKKHDSGNIGISYANRHIKTIYQGHIVASDESNSLQTKTFDHIQKPFQCEKCSKRFQHKCHFKRHLKTHLKGKYKCSFCEEQFNSLPPFKEHTYFHTGIRPFYCNKCRKSFRTESSYKIHISSKWHKKGGNKR